MRGHFLSLSDEQFVGLFSQHDRELYRYIRTLMPDPVQAEDVYQETVMALWKKRDRYDAAEPFLPWCCRFALYEVLHHRRTVKRQRLVFSQALLEKLAEERASYQPSLLDRRAALRKCMEKLSPVDRELIGVRYGSDQTVQQLAEASGRSAKSLYRALERVRRLLLECIDRSQAQERRA